MNITLAIIMFAVAVVTMVISIRAFMEKGFVINNKFIYANEKEREKIDKKPYYRQTAVVFLLITIIFIVNGVSALVEKESLLYIVILLAVVTIVYAVSSSIAIGKKEK